MKTRQNKLQDKKEQNGEGDDEGRKEGELHREHKALRRIQRLHQHHPALGVELGIGVSFEEGSQLFALLFPKYSGWWRCIAGAPFFFDVESGAKVKGGLDMKGEVLVPVGHEFLEIQALGFVHPHRIVGDLNCLFPSG